MEQTKDRFELNSTCLETIKQQIVTYYHEIVCMYTCIPYRTSSHYLYDMFKQASFWMHITFTPKSIFKKIYKVYTTQNFILVDLRS